MTPAENRHRISIHALRKESDRHIAATECDVMLFQSTLSVRRATDTIFGNCHNYGISIHALRKESDGYVQEVAEHLDISIHALRKESDLFEIFVPLRQSISIHALRKESDRSLAAAYSDATGFQSTLSVRRATGDVAFWKRSGIFQSTLSVRRATRHVA